MSQTSYKNQHLVSNIENTEENRNYVKSINKRAKESQSVYRLYIRYRKPIDGEKYGWGGSLKKENAKAFSIYIQDKTPYDQTGYYKLRDKYFKLERENELLEKKIAILENPYMHWSLEEIDDELFDVKEDCIERFVEAIGGNGEEDIEDDKVREKYKLLTKAQAIKQGVYHE